jgi:hypothetical protein
MGRCFCWDASSARGFLLLTLSAWVCDTVCRSGWQPPKDTGLWEVSARVSDAIQQQMTPAQQEYWTGENGYFAQVRHSNSTGTCMWH